MGFFLFLVYLVLSFLRPGELFLDLAGYPIMDVAGGLALVASLLALMAGRGPTFRAPQIYLVTVFILWAAFSVVAAVHWFGGGFQVLATWGTNLAVFFALLVLNLDSFRRLRATVILLIVLVACIVGQAILAYHFGYSEQTFVMTQRVVETPEGMEFEDLDSPPESTENLPERTVNITRRIRHVGFLADPNELAQALVSFLPFVFVLGRQRWSVSRVLSTGTAAALLLYGIYLTRSRGGLLALLVVVLVASRDRVGRTASMILTGLAAVALPLLGFLGGRAISLDESAAGRTDAWSAGLTMLKSSPVWGVGFGNFLEHHDLVAHNSFVHVFAELGLVGFFFWLAILVVTLTDLSTLTRLAPGEPTDYDFARWARASRLSITGFLAGAFFLSRGYGIMLFLLVGLATALSDIARKAGRPVAEFDPLRVGAYTAVVEVVMVASVYLIVRIAR